MISYMTHNNSASAIHRLHPLTKLVFLICYCVLALTLSNPWYSLFLLFIIFVLIKLAKISIRIFLRKAKVILLFCVVLFVVQLLFTQEGEILFSLIPSLVPVIGGALPVTTVGIGNGAVMAARFLSIVASSFLFISTTYPNTFAYALMQLGLPYRYGFTLITTLRFLPLFSSEFSVVRRAQTARGMKISIHPKKIMQTIRLTFLPLLVSGLVKVDALSISMEGRGFGAYKDRTFLRKIEFTKKDVATCMLIPMLTMIIIVLALWLKLPATYYI
ncbi:energy-coupling factor transporter transmembrane protein EcfT [Candidatus Bathyarchaeota archaeon]|nr:energy-coupling factor transporter transmembrane protein EcfT [Candidatus Bathyarchaeota archaeon]MCK4481767.1 energy-coupling factor transporter transmembrane protein EcfT [Candidatus Bathyarchaeota archaeon]